MSDIAVQASFNSGEWAPSLNARVDISKYKSGAALIENWFVDYRGGVSSRPGTKYVIQALNSSAAVRLIPFQAAFNIGYILEFGAQYIRFIFDGSPVLENSFPITGATNADPCVLTVTGNNYNVGDWIFVSGVVGMTELNSRYFSVLSVTGNSVTLGDLNGNQIDSTGYGAYTSGGTAARVYVLQSPYAAADLALVKFAQSTNQMILCHPAYPTQVLTLNSAANWTISPMTIGASISAPTNVTASTTLATGHNTTYSYVVTSINSNGQESEASTPAGISNVQDIRTTSGSNEITWDAVPGAVAYNVYESEVSYFGVLPSGITYGFIGTTRSNSFIDSNIGPDFSQSPPLAGNPFIGGSVQAINLTAQGTYTSVPTVSFSGGTPQVAATASAVLQCIGTPSVNLSTASQSAGEHLNFAAGIVAQVKTVDSNGFVTSFYPITSNGSNPGSVAFGSVPSNPLTDSSGHVRANFTWGVGFVNIDSPGLGYETTPDVVFSSGSAAATCTVSENDTGFPAVPSFFQERLVLAATADKPQTFYLSQPGNYFNFDTSSPVQPTDAITATLVAGVLNTIKAIVSSTAGMLILTDKSSWLVNGGTSGSAVSPESIVANAQSFIGANDVPPIVANYDVLYVQGKGSGVRDLAYNIYFNVFTGTDISIISSHLFYGFEILEWAWAEQPFYVVWAIRDDGVMLSLTFLKEQDFIGWSHHVTNGSFLSVATVTENTDTGNVDAVYVVVEREVEGNTVKYIERMAERSFNGDASGAWCVDAALQYNGTLQDSFTGAEHLAGLVCTGLADGIVIPPFTMPANGEFTIPTPAAVVTVGLGFTCDLQTLALDVGEPSIQGKTKKIPCVDVRVKDTLGLSIGNDFDHLTAMKDLIVGNVSSMLTGQESQIVTGLVTGDARTFLNPTYTIPGQYCIRQSYPLPASVLGVFPCVVVGDDR